MKNQKPWTRQEDEILLRMREQRKSVREIASALNRSKNSVWKRRAVLAERNEADRYWTLWTVEEDTFITEQFQEGVSDRLIAARLARVGFDRTERAVRERRKMLGLRSNALRTALIRDAEAENTNKSQLQKWDDEFRALMQAALDAGLETGGLTVDLKDRRAA